MKEEIQKNKLKREKIIKGKKEKNNKNINKDKIYDFNYFMSLFLKSKFTLIIIFFNLSF